MSSLGKHLNFTTFLSHTISICRAQKSGGDRWWLQRWGLFLPMMAHIVAMWFFLFSFTKGGLCVCWPKGSWFQQHGAYSIEAQFYQEKDCCRIMSWQQVVQLHCLRSSWPGIGLTTWAIWGKEAACSVTQLSLMQTAGIGIGMFVCLYVWLLIIKTKKVSHSWYMPVISALKRVLNNCCCLYSCCFYWFCFELSQLFALDPEY